MTVYSNYPIECTECGSKTSVYANDVRDVINSLEIAGWNVIYNNDKIMGLCPFCKEDIKLKEDIF